MKMINRNNCEEFFMLYVDGELNAADKISVEKFVAENPDLSEELNLLKETVFVADNEIVFENKEELYKHKRKIIGFYWWKVAAVVIVLFGVTVWGYLYLETSTPRGRLSSVETYPAVTNPKIAETKQLPAKIIDKTQPTRAKIQRHVKAGYASVSEQPRLQKRTSTPRGRPSFVETYTAGTDIAIPVVPQKIKEEKLTEQLPQKENKTIKYEYVDPAENDMIYVANTSVSKRNKFRGVIRKATRILDRVTSIN